MRNFAHLFFASVYVYVPNGKMFKNFVLKS